MLAVPVSYAHGLAALPTASFRSRVQLEELPFLIISVYTDSLHYCHTTLGDSAATLGHQGVAGGARARSLRAV